MKTLKLKPIIVACVVTIIATVGFSGFAYGNPPESAKAGLRQERLAINKDLAAINLQQDKVKSLEKQCSDEHKAGVKSGPVHNDLLKAQADLQREKAYLKADKDALLSAHYAVISEREKRVRTERTELWSNGWKAVGSVFKAKPAAVSQAQAVVDAKHELKQNEKALRHARQNRNSDLLLVNREIRDAKGESAFVLSVEDAGAKTQNLAMKIVK